MTTSIAVSDLAGTALLGRDLAELLFPGAVVALVGPLGAGKTHFVKAIAEGLHIANSAVVNSPTFVLIQEYDARLPMYHFDAYRLKGEAEFADLGPEEYFRGDGVSLVEWADKVAGCLPAQYLEIRIELTGETSRRFELTAHGPRYEELLARLNP
jgi:tRNA threonylcarbamoyladenosine biosynthesis protein TsaE